MVEGHTHVAFSPDNDVGHIRTKFSNNIKNCKIFFSIPTKHYCTSKTRI